MSTAPEGIGESTLAAVSAHAHGATMVSALPRTVFGYVWQTSRRDQIRLTLLTVSVFMIDLAPLELQRHIVNHALAGGLLSLLLAFCGGYAVAVLIAGALKLVLNVYRAAVSETATRNLRRQAFARSETTGQAISGPRVAIIVTEVEAVGGFVGASLSEPILQAGVLLSVFGYMLFLQPWIALMSLMLFLPQIYVVPRLQRMINERAKSRIGAVRDIAGDLVVDGQHDGRATQQFETHITRVYGLNLEIFKLKFLMNFLMNLLSHLGTVGVFLIGGSYVLAGKLDLGTVVAFVAGMAKLNDPWGDLVNYFRDVTVAQVKYRLIADAIAVDAPRPSGMNGRP